MLGTILEAGGEGGASLVDRAQILKTLPARFDAEGLTVEQRFATSADGTRVPYFLVVKGDVPTSGMRECRKRPINIGTPQCVNVKRGLFVREKRPINVSTSKGMSVH